jgi:hypothetical protein
MFLHYICDFFVFVQISLSKSFVLHFFQNPNFKEKETQEDFFLFLLTTLTDRNVYMYCGDVGMWSWSL